MQRITKKDKYAILWLNHIGYTTEEISIELDIVAKKISNVVKQSASTVPQTSAESSKKYQEMMITRSESQQRPVSIMTKEASAASDDIPPKRLNQETLSKNIYRIN